jgi:TPR repeat protein
MLESYQGDIRGQTNLGFCYNQIEDHPSAVKWYQIAAEKGDPRSQTNLGWCYERGLGVQMNPQYAVRYYRMAADQNDHVGITNLACCYANGVGVEKDVKKAIQLFQQAADLGNEVAKSNLVVCQEGQGTVLGHSNGQQASNDSKSVSTAGTTSTTNTSASSGGFDEQAQSVVAYQRALEKPSSILTAKRPDAKRRSIMIASEPEILMTMAASNTPADSVASNANTNIKVTQSATQTGGLTKNTSYSRSVPLGRQLSQAFEPIELYDRSMEYLEQMNRTPGKQQGNTPVPSKLASPFTYLNLPLPSHHYLEDIATPLPTFMTNVPPNVAFQEYLKASAKGDVDAVVNIGWCFEKGYGTAVSVEKAVEYYQLGVAAKHPRAMVRAATDIT